MDANHLKKILGQVASGELDIAEAMESMRVMPFSDMGFAKHDWHRPLRNGFAEVILCEGKRVEHLIAVTEHAVGEGHDILGTRADASVLDEIRRRFPQADCDPVSRTFIVRKRTPEQTAGRLAVVAAGTADVSVAEEACRTAQFFGLEARRYYDVGVAGLQRLLSCVEQIREADVVIVVAGMEGALPSVVGGLLGSPIIAVPTSVGYGANFKGVAALLGMLNSCSEGLTVVNIDNGFGAACAALRIMRLMKRAK